MCNLSLVNKVQFVLSPCAPSVSFTTLGSIAFSNCFPFWLVSVYWSCNSIDSWILGRPTGQLTYIGQTACIHVLFHSTRPIIKHIYIFLSSYLLTIYFKKWLHSWSRGWKWCILHINELLFYSVFFVMYASMEINSQYAFDGHTHGIWLERQIYCWKTAI